MKKNIAMRVASLVLMCTIVTSCFVSSTFAKYTSSASGSDTVTVAKWMIKLNDEQTHMTETVTFNLFDTIKDYDGSNEDNVHKTDGVVDRIAPGTSGAFALKVTNSSEVDAQYKINFTVSNTTLPLEYSIDGKNWYSDVTDVATKPLVMGATETINVQWRWPFEVGTGDTLKENDANDTALGLTNTTVTVSATLVVEQVD